MIGRTLSHFEITAELGAGGMGTVYRAQDTRLGREVAIKILPEAFTADAERLARFEREAKLLASLNHPNIAGIYEVDEIDGLHFLAMELAEGEDLASHMARGPVPVDEALRIALQIAAGLETAHHRGIVHRDLKPANIKLGPSGQVKILDFGLAKAWEGPREASPNLTASPTLTAQMTQAGVILGTAAYMAPEQARGEEADQRADVWAFGVILYEMLTGEQLFREPTVSDTLAAVLRADLDLDRLPAETPWRTRDVLARCLERDPRQRMHAIADARIELARRDSPAPIEAAEAPYPSQLAKLLPWALAAVLGLALLWSLATQESGTGDRAAVYFDIELPPGYQLSRDGAVMALSPDGSRVVIRGDAGTQTQFFLRDLGDPELRPIAGTEGASGGTFSPDGTWLAFISGDKLRKISLEAGTVIELTDAEWAGAAAWGENGDIVYTPTYADGLWLISENGGTPRELTVTDKGRKELGHFWPQFLPGETRVLFTNFKPPLSETRIEVVELASGERTVLVEGAAHGLYRETGHLVYVRNETLFAAPFDAGTLALTGTAVPIASDIAYNEYQGSAFLSASKTGTLGFLRASVLNPHALLVWVDRDGREEPVVPELRQYKDPSISPDGSRIALAIRDGQPDIWVLEVRRGSLLRLTDQPTSELSPFWTPDGSGVVFIRDSPPYDILRVAADGTGSPVVLAEDDRDKIPYSVSPGGDILFEHSVPGGVALGIVSIDGGEVRELHRSRYAESNFHYSPDGRWITLSSNESGRREVYVRAAVPGAAKQQISLDGGTDPLWSRDGREVYYWRGYDLMAVPIATEPELDIGRPERLFTGNYQTSTTNRSYDQAPDGRFVMVKIPPGSEPRRISIIHNFDALLERTVPTD